MTPIPSRRGHYRVAPNEEITVFLKDTINVQPLVNYTWNNVGQPPQPFSVPFTRPIDGQVNPNTLGILVNFFDETGGAYTVVLSGSLNGTYFDHREAAGSFDNAQFWFEIG